MRILLHNRHRGARSSANGPLRRKPINLSSRQILINAETFSINIKGPLLTPPLLFVDGSKQLGVIRFAPVTLAHLIGAKPRAVFFSFPRLFCARRVKLGRPRDGFWAAERSGVTGGRRPPLPVRVNHGTTRGCRHVSPLTCDKAPKTTARLAPSAALSDDTSSHFWFFFPGFQHVCFSQRVEKKKKNV